MTVYSDQLAAASREPQVIVEVAVTSCDNFYASGEVHNQCDETEGFQAAAWTKSGGTTVTADQYDPPEASDGYSDADKVAFAAAADYIESNASVDNAASTTWTVSLWARTDAGTGTISLEIRNDGGGLETTRTVFNITTTLARIWVTKTFTAGAGGKVRMRVVRDVGDVAAVGLWGAAVHLGSQVLNYKSVAGTGTTFMSHCTATDAGVGNRCWLSAGTCQDPGNFKVNQDGPYPGLKRFRFCLKDAPLPLGGEDILPYIKSVEFTPQKIDPERAVTVNERVTITFYDDAVTNVWNQDRLALGGLVNSGTPSGTFWRRFMRIYRNYANPRNYVIVKRGFVASGMTEALYVQRGKYLINNITIGGDGLVTMELTDALRLTKRTASGTSNAKLPVKISETNLLNGTIIAGDTTIAVDDIGEIPDPDGDFTTCLELEPGTVNNEFVNVTAKLSTIAGTLTVQRGRWGTTAIGHADNVPFRVVLQFGTENPTPASAPLGKNPIDIVVEILRMCGIAMADIDTTTLYDERDTWLSGSVSGTTETGILFKRCGETPDSGNGCIAQQTDAEELLKQIREICLLNLWVGEDQIITGRVFAPARPSVTLTEITDGESIVKNSIEVDDNEESRLTRIVVGYDIRADAGGDKLADYQKIMVRVGSDEEAEGNYGDERTRVLLSPWCRVTDTASIDKLTAHLLGRFRNPARRVSFALELKDDDNVACGDFVNLTTTHIQNPDGSTDGPRIMEILSKQMASDMATIGYECMDTGLTLKYGFIAPAGQPDWDSATTAQQRYAYIGNAAANQLGTGSDPGFYIW